MTLRPSSASVTGTWQTQRVNHAARTVITADPNVSVSQLGVPLEMARDLTMKERVRPDNIAALSALVAAGPHRYPGANRVLRPLPDGVTLISDPELLVVNVINAPTAEDLESEGAGVATETATDAGEAAEGADEASAEAASE